MGRKHEPTGQGGEEIYADEQPGGDLLDAALQQTLLHQNELARLNERERAALIQTAQELESRQADMPTVALELVKTLLSVRYAKLRSQPGRLAEVAQFVADELLESPAAEQRLNSLWQHLKKGSP